MCLSLLPGGGMLTSIRWRLGLEGSSRTSYATKRFALRPQPFGQDGVAAGAGPRSQLPHQHARIPTPPSAFLQPRPERVPFVQPCFSRFSTVLPARPSTSAPLAVDTVIEATACKDQSLRLSSGPAHSLPFPLPGLARSSAPEPLPAQAFVRGGNFDRICKDLRGRKTSIVTNVVAYLGELYTILES